MSFMGFAFAVLKPDAVVRRIAPSILETIEEEGFAIKNFRIGRAPDELLWEMHGKDLRWDVDDWCHNMTAYSFGPIVGLLLWDKGSLPLETPAQGRLARLKGGSLPANFGPGSLRTRYGAQNRIFNLLHSADSTELAITEARIWFEHLPEDVGEIDAWLTRISSEVSNEIARHEYDAALDFDEERVWRAVNFRLQHALRFRANLTDEMPRVAQQVSSILNAASAFKGYAPSYLLGLTELAGVYISPLERFLIETKFRYPRDAQPIPRR